jgi:transcriptional regulator with XRE-family HTH domain
MGTIKDYQFKRLTLAPLAHPIVKFIWDEILKQRISPEFVAFKAGISVTTLRKWKYPNRSPCITHIESVLNVLGYDLTMCLLSDEGCKSGRLIGSK